ncbi:isochorismate synthase [Flavobacterium sp.]|jgi:isochorismate synthase|uniref:isochorismate synthase n=1 Tax=Flavobacterium sp. TaxID=239 RepID=UPI0037C19D62
MNLLEKADFYFQNQLPFVVYAKPNETILQGIFQKDATLHVFENQNGFVFAGFYNTTNVVFPLTDSEVFQEEMIYKIEKQTFNIEHNSDENAQKSFENLVQKAVSEIENGTFQKVVVSRKIEISQSVDVIKSYQKLLKTYPTAFRYLWYHPQVGLWMGATPEQLTKINNHTFETVSLAGTQVVSENVIWQEKEVEEHQLVTDYIKNSTENLVENIQISKAYTQKAGNVVHLKSDISGKLKLNSSENDIIHALHPTSAVCGMPLEAARNFILENEKYDRKYYSGFLGELRIQELTNLFVNLRCCEIENDVTTIYAGCGITKDSQVEKEFIETENKAKTILSVLCY